MKLNLRPFTLTLAIILTTLSSSFGQSIRPAHECDCDNSCGQFDFDLVAGIVAKDARTNAMLFGDGRDNVAAGKDQAFEPQNLLEFQSTIDALGDQDRASWGRYVQSELAVRDVETNETDLLALFEEAVRASTKEKARIDAALTALASEAIEPSDVAEIDRVFDKEGWSRTLPHYKEVRHRFERIEDPELDFGAPQSDITMQRNSAAIERCKKAVRTSASLPARQCSQSVGALCGTNCAHGLCRKQCSFDALRKKLVFDKDPTTISRFHQYDQNCLDWPARENKIVKKQFDFDLIAARTGVLRIDRSKAGNRCRRWSESRNLDVFCTATVVTGDYVLTARHCFVGEDGGWSPEKQCIQDGAVQFYTIATPNRAVTVSGMFKPEEVKERERVYDDYAHLKLASPLSEIKTGTEFGRPPIYAPAFIMAYHYLAKPYGDKQWPEWRKKIRWTRPNCVVTRVSDKCTLTKCQTIDGYSGAPLWTLNDRGQTVFSGLQVEGGTGRVGECGFAADTIPLGGSGNLAINGFLTK